MRTIPLKKAFLETNGTLLYEAFSFVTVPRESWAPKKESLRVSLLVPMVPL